MRKAGIKMLVMAIAVAAVCGACKKKSQDEYGSLVVKMTDSPGTYLQVNVDIKRVDVHLANGNSWVTLASNPGVYDLLTLQNNVTAVLANGTNIPAGKVSQLRLILGTNNSVKLASDSSVHTLTIPSSLNSGIKIDVDATIPNKSTLTITLDYDANSSVTQNGNGDYVMNPVIHVKSIQ